MEYPYPKTSKIIHTLNPLFGNSCLADVPNPSSLAEQPKKERNEIKKINFGYVNSAQSRTLVSTAPKHVIIQHLFNFFYRYVCNKNSGISLTKYTIAHAMSKVIFFRKNF